MSDTRAEFFKCQGEYRNQASEVRSPLVRQAYNSVSCNAWPGGVNSDPADPTHPDSEACLFFWEVATVFLYDLKHNTISSPYRSFPASWQYWRLDTPETNK